MALKDKKILETERNAVYVKSNPGTRLKGTVSQNKDAFDKFPQLLMTKLNELIDLLIVLGLDSVAQDLGNRYTKGQVDSLVETATNDLVRDMGIDLTTGIITITKKNGTFEKIDTALEKVPASFEFISEGDGYFIKVTNVDGTSSKTNVTNLMNKYTFSQGENIIFAIEQIGTNTTVSATIKSGSITMEQLNASIKAYFDGLKSGITADKEIVISAKNEAVNASQNATGAVVSVTTLRDEAENFAKLSKSYAVGQSGVRPEESIDNAMYYSEVSRGYSSGAATSANQALQYRNEAEQFRNQAQQMSNVPTKLSQLENDTNFVDGEKYTTLEKTKLSGIATGATKNTVLNSTLTLGTTWTDEGSLKVQTVNVSGVLATDNPQLDVVAGTTDTTDVDEWSKINKAVSNNGSIKFYFREATTKNLTVQVKVVR